MGVLDTEAVDHFSRSVSVSDDVFDAFISALLKGNRKACNEITESLIASGVFYQEIYEHLFQEALYQVGDLWETNQISVATEHMATSITEGLMSRVYARLEPSVSVQQKVVITSIENEQHQIGGKMISDVFEMAGWESYYLGANTTSTDLIDFLHEHQPGIIGISVSIYYHIPQLIHLLNRLQENFPDRGVLIGGQAFRHGGRDIADQFINVYYISDLHDLETRLRRVNGNPYAKGQWLWD